jgi:hypothetical protein
MAGLEQHNGGRAIHVIIAVDEDRLQPRDGCLHPRYRRGHPLHGVRIKQLFHARVKKNLSFGRAFDPTLRQQFGHDQRETGALRQDRRRGGVCRGQNPLVARSSPGG